MEKTLDDKYLDLLLKIKNHGYVKDTRNGVTYSVFGEQIKHKMSDGFPLLTTKKMAVKTIMAELKWFLSGSTDIRKLREMGCHIWDGDCYARYERLCKWEFDEVDSKEEFFHKVDNNIDGYGDRYADLGPIYGHQWRNWGSYIPFGQSTSSLDKGYDQLENVLFKLKNVPDSRRIMVNAWDAGRLDEMTLPPCHYGFQLFTREMSDSERWLEAVKAGVVDTPHDRGIQELDKLKFPERKISLLWNQRSADVPLGLPFNLASYGMLLLLFANEANMISDELIVNIGDAHIYANQLEGIEIQLKRKQYNLPTVKIKESNILEGQFEYELENYVSCETIKYPLSN